MSARGEQTETSQRYGGNSGAPPAARTFVADVIVAVLVMPIDGVEGHYQLDERLTNVGLVGREL